MAKRDRLPLVAAVSNGGVFLGLTVFVAAIAAETASAALSGEWFHVLGWLLLVAALVGIVWMGVSEQLLMRRARRARRSGVELREVPRSPRD